MYIHTYVVCKHVLVIVSFFKTTLHKMFSCKKTEMGIMTLHGRNGAGQEIMINNQSNTKTH